MYIMGIVNDLADARGALIHGTAPLPDIGMDWLPYIPEFWWLSDYLIQVCLLTIATRILTLKQNRKRLFCLFVEMHQCLLLMRCITVPMTTFPAASLSCEYKLAPKPMHFLIEPILKMMRPDGFTSWCNDFLFSGHGMFFSITALFINEAPGRIWWRVLGWGNALLGLVMLVSARHHYTVDVVIAFLFSFLVVQQWKPELRALFRESVLPPVTAASSRSPADNNSVEHA